MSRIVPGIFTFLILALLLTGIYIVYYSEIIVPEGAPEHSPSGLLKVIFGVHLALWMVLGMFANYVWDLFKAGGAWQQITTRGLLLPVLVSPIVFFSIWSLWKNQPISFAWPLISFQNGFFWQVVFSKAAPDGGGRHNQSNASGDVVPVQSENEKP